jgi:hypothetical protein
MSRAANQAVLVKPTSNIYTVLVASAVIVEIVGLLYVWQTAFVLHGKYLFAQ